MGFTSETAKAANRKRHEARRKAEREYAAQFDRDLRGDHDGPRSHWLPPADSTPTAAEVLSWED